MDRFLAYTKGREPVLSVNVIAAILLGFIVKVTEQYGLWVWDEFSLIAAGTVTVAIATWLARRFAWSPTSVGKVREQAYQQGAEDAVVRKVETAPSTGTSRPRPVTPRKPPTA